MDYSKGKIYKIIDTTNGDIYIGSTAKTLKRRFQVHGMFKLYDKKKEDCEIILIEDYPCDSRAQLEEREQYHIDNTDCINMKSACRDEDNFKIKDKIYHAINHTRRMKDQSYRDKRNEQSRKLLEYQNSWGGRPDQDNLSMLRINPDYFLV